MAMNQCMKLVPLVGLGRLGRLGRRAALPVSQQVRTLFDPWTRSSDIRALVRDMDRQMDRLEREMFRGLPSFLPRLVPVGRSADHTLGPREGGQYRVAVDVAGFKPEEINIALDDAARRLTITAKCERHGKDGSRYAQEISRHITLPDSIDAAQLKSVLHHDGVLAIEAPFKVEQVEQVEPRQIPISRSGELGSGEQPKEDGKEKESSN